MDCGAMHMGWHTMGREKTHSSQDVEQLCSMVCFLIPTQGFLTFPVKSVGNFSGWVISQTSSPLTSWLPLQAFLCKWHQLLPQKRCTRNAQFQKRTSTVSSGILVLTISTQQEYCNFSEIVIFIFKYYKNGSSTSEVWSTCVKDQASAECY